MSIELNCENLEVALLVDQAALAGFEIKNFADDDGAVDKNRIVVQAMPREVELPAFRLDRDPKVWRVPVNVTVRSMSLTPSQLDAIITAVEAANGGTPPASVVTTAVGLFPNGVVIENTDDGDADHTDNTRERTKVFNFLVKP
jgi:hypothetical protein